VAAALLAGSALAAKPKQKTAVFRGEVVRFDSVSITVRDAKQPLRLHTFTYTAKLREKIIKMLETGGYQYGTKVKIRYLPGRNVAVSIHGKVSKRKHPSGKRK
jgi:hypothetical protein